MEEVYGGAIDRPEATDYIDDEIVGAVDGVLPLEIKWKTKADNQGNSQMCTTFATYHVGRILNEIEHQMELKGKPEKGWELQGEFGTRIKGGDYVQTALKSIVKNGLICENGTYQIEGYASVKKDNLRQRLAQGFPIITSMDVTSTNMKKAKLGIWGGKDGKVVTGHAIALVGYCEGYYWALNSYGPDWGVYKDGTFKIDEKDIQEVNTCYLLYDHKDIAMIFRDVSNKAPFAKEIQWALDKGLAKGYDNETIPNAVDRFFMPEKPITRAEAIALFYRYDQYINNR